MEGGDHRACSGIVARILMERSFIAGNQNTMKPFFIELQNQAAQRANQQYFNLLARNKWLPAIRMKDALTSEKPDPALTPELELLEPGKEN